VTVNGSEQRNYAHLGVWWTLRAELIADYRRLRAARPELLNSRLDYAKLHELAAQQQQATAFTELRTYTPMGQNKAIVDIGSKAQPFKLFLPTSKATLASRSFGCSTTATSPKTPTTSAAATPTYRGHSSRSAMSQVR